MFNWDGYDCATATVTCKAFASHTVDLDVTVTSETTEPTADADGETVYTAAFTVDGTTYQDVKTEILPAAGEDEPDEPVAPADGTAKLHGEHCVCYDIESNGVFASIMRFFCAIRCFFWSIYEALGV